MILQILIILFSIAFNICQEIRKIDIKNLRYSESITIKYIDGSKEQIYKNPIGTYMHTDRNQCTGLDKEQGRGIFDRFKTLHENWQQNNSNNKN